MQLRRPAIALGIAGAGLLPGAAFASGNKTVLVKGFEFTPAVIHVDKGGAVTWKFQDEHVSHNVTSRGKKRFQTSESQRENTTYVVTFKKAGTYRYVCTIHAGMKGKVVVG